MTDASDTPHIAKAPLRRRLRDSPVAWELRRTPLWGLWQKAKSIRTEASQAWVTQSLFYEMLVGPCRSGTIIDIGANIGSKTEIFRLLASKVVAVEPDPDMAASLARRFKWRPEVEIENCAVSNREGSLTLFKFRGSEAFNTASFEWAEAMMNASNHMALRLEEPERIIVPAITLASIEAKHRPVRFIKIDAEGFEFEILSTLLRPVPVISLEFNLPEFTRSLHKSIAKLEQLDPSYRFNVTTTEPPTTLEFEQWLPAGEALDRIDRSGWRYLELFGRSNEAS